MPRKKYYKKTDANKNYWCKECEELSENKTCLHCNKQNEKVSEKSWCEEKTNGEECGQLKYFVAEWIGGGGSDHYAPHAYDYECHDQQCQNCEKHKFARDFPWLDETRVCDECWWDAIKKNPEQAQELENYKNSTNAEEKRTYEKYKKLKDKMSKGNNDRERERERDKNYQTEIWNSAIRTNC